MAQNGPGPAITPRTRARARHILDHYYIGPARDSSVLEIWGYTPKMSYAPGDQVALHVSTTAAEWDLEIGRDGSAYQPLLTETGLPGQHHETPRDCSVIGCGWPAAYEFTIPGELAARRLFGDLSRTARRRHGRGAPRYSAAKRRRRAVSTLCSGLRDRHLAGLQLLGRIEPLRRDRGARRQRIFARSVHAAPMDPRFLQIA